MSNIHRKKERNREIERERNGEVTRRIDDVSIFIWLDEQKGGRALLFCFVAIASMTTLCARALARPRHIIITINETKEKLASFIRKRNVPRLPFNGLFFSVLGRFRIVQSSFGTMSLCHGPEECVRVLFSCACVLSMRARSLCRCLVFCQRSPSHFA